MFDLSSEFKRFYRECVVLPETKQAELRTSRKKNIKRFKSGLVEYNKLNQTDYEISETLTQGSMAMHTTVQDTNNDYDIDVALVMDSKDIADISPLTLRRVVGESWNIKSGNMNIPAEVKTGCVRVRYSKGYHLIKPKGTNLANLLDYQRCFASQEVNGRCPLELSRQFSVRNVLNQIYAWISPFLLQ